MLCGRVGMDNFCLDTEGFNKLGEESAPTRFGCDPIDGTVYYVRAGSANPAPVTIALSCAEGPRYGDVTAGAIANLWTGETWSASRGGIAQSNLMGEIRAGKNLEHNVVILSDFFFPANSEARTKMQLGDPKYERFFESLNLGSGAEQPVKVACSEADAFLSVGNPGGLKGYEIAAGLPIVLAAGGHVLDYRTGESIEHSELNFNERVPIIVGRDEAFARKIYEQVTAA